MFSFVIVFHGCCIICLILFVFVRLQCKYSVNVLYKYSLNLTRKWCDIWICKNYATSSQAKTKPKFILKSKNVFGLSPLKRKKKYFIQTFINFIHAFANPIDASVLSCCCCCHAVVLLCVCHLRISRLYCRRSLRLCVCAMCRCCGVWYTRSSSSLSSSSSSLCTLQPVIVVGIDVFDGVWRRGGGWFATANSWNFGRFLIVRHCSLATWICTWFSTQYDLDFFHSIFDLHAILLHSVYDFMYKFCLFCLIFYVFSYFMYILYRSFVSTVRILNVSLVFRFYLHCLLYHLHVFFVSILTSI